jgi:hypothetical protein
MSTKVSADLAALKALLATFASAQSAASTGPLAPLQPGYGALGTAIGTWPSPAGVASTNLKAE